MKDFSSVKDKLFLLLFPANLASQFWSLCTTTATEKLPANSKDTLLQEQHQSKIPKSSIFPCFWVHIDLVDSYKDDPMNSMSDCWFTADRASTTMWSWSASRASVCFKLNNNPSLVPFPVPKLVLIFCQHFLFILQAFQSHFIWKSAQWSPRFPHKHRWCSILNHNDQLLADPLMPHPHLTVTRSRYFQSHFTHLRWLNGFHHFGSQQTCYHTRTKFPRKNASSSRTFFSSSRAHSVTDKGFHRFPVQRARINEGVSHFSFAEC